MFLRSIHVYPIKSCGGIALDVGVLDALGLVGDRRLVVVTPDGEFLTQREAPRLALVKIRFAAGNIPQNAPLAEQLVLTTATSTLALGPANGPRRSVRVWGDPCDAIEHRVGSEFFSDHLERPVVLVELAGDASRPAPQEHARPTDRVAFTDAFPLLVISEASLADLDARLPEPVPMDRFRPNLVIADAEPYAEDSFGRFRVGEVEMRAVKPCSRCVITTVDQSSGIASREPLRTLASYRKVGSKVMFGQNVLHDAIGTLHIGDDVCIMS